jgi:cbb3-type cytochrome oxidase subunit 3
MVIYVYGEKRRKENAPSRRGKIKFGRKII